MAKAGRPRVLDEVKRREVCALVSTGYGLEGAARYVCCSVKTVRREARRNAEFNQRLRSAQLTAELTPLRAIREKSQTHWRAAAWLLERTLPDKFGKPDRKLLNPAEVEQLFDALICKVVSELGTNSIEESCCEIALHNAKKRVLTEATASFSPGEQSRLVNRALRFLAAQQILRETDSSESIAQ